MNPVFSGQSKLEITIDVEAPITGVQSASIEYQNPRGLRGSWPSVVESELNGIIKVIITDEEQTKPAGKWKVWAKITYLDGRVIFGETAVINFLPPGSLQTIP